MNKLSFIQTSYKGSSFDEFAIDGRPLSTIIETQDGYCPISRKQSWADSDSNDYLKCLMLKMKSSLSSGRPILYYLCKHCGDINCGIISVKVEEIDDFIIWKDFQVEHNAEITPVKFLKTLRGPLRFSKKEYFELLNSRMHG